MFAFAILGALTAFALLASLLPSSPTVRERDPDLVPLVPTITRKRHGDVWGEVMRSWRARLPSGTTAVGMSMKTVDYRRAS